MASLPQRVGFVPAFPVPGGINQSSLRHLKISSWHGNYYNKSMAAAKWISSNTKNLGSGPQSIVLSQTIPYYEKMMSMIPIGHSRNSISEYPQTAEDVREAVEDVYNGLKEPKQALDDAAAKSAKALGW